MNTCPDCQRPLFEDLVHVCRRLPADRPSAGATTRVEGTHEPRRLDGLAESPRALMYADAYLPWGWLRAK